MKKFYVIFICMMCVGCASTQSTVYTEVLKDLEVTRPEETLTSAGLDNIAEDQLEEIVTQKGVIFAKTDFQGVLKASYVRLLFEHIDDPQQKFELHIEGDLGETKLPWNGKMVKPGYFFIELPEGQYKISSISIPVGTTMATEDIKISLEVLPNAITYVGTLRVNGTKEKLKLGGVPVIKPGFEYTFEILDESDEGINTFRLRYPKVTNKIGTQLMQVYYENPKPE